MQVNKAYEFFFKPFSNKHSTEIKALSFITVVALSILTAGGFLIAFGIVNLCDRKFSVNKPKDDKITPTAKAQIQLTNLSPESQKKIKQVKEKNIEQVRLFETWAQEKDWKRFRPEFSHYDWWAFPITRPSAGYGDKYAVNSEEIQALKADDEFMQSYRRGVELVVNSWGWDLKNDAAVPEDKRLPDQSWTGYGVRLGKMADSLKLFDETDLYGKLQHFFDEICIPLTNKYPLEKWIYTNLARPKVS